MVRSLTAHERFSLELVRQVPEDKRCPYFKCDNEGPYCGKNLKDDAVEEERRMACDHVSLQMWCLDIERCGKCITYQGEQF